MSPEGATAAQATAPRSARSDRGAARDLHRLLPPQLVEQARSAVDEHEVAVVLEAGGIDDRVASQDYGSPDVFHLALLLHATIDRPAAVPSPPRRDWYVSPPVALLRGCVFTVSGLVAVGLAAEGAGHAAGLWVLVSCAVWIAILQGVSFLAYLLIERGGPGAPASAAFPALASFVVPPLIGLAAAAAAGPRAGLATTAALLSLTGIVLLLVVDRPGLVAAVVLPVGGIAVLAAVDGPVGIDSATAVWAVGAIVLTVATSVVLRSRRHRGPLQLSSADVHAALPFVVVGLGIGALSIATVAVAAPSPVLAQASGGDWLVAALPFLLPVSLAELLVVQLRRSLLASTARESELTTFRRVARRRTVVMWVLQLAIGATAAVGSAIALGVVRDVDAWSSDVVALVALFATLATVLTAGLLLLSCERVHVAAAVLWSAAVGMAGVRAVADGWSGAAVWVLVPIAAVGVLVSIPAAGRIASFR